MRTARATYIACTAKFIQCTHAHTAYIVNTPCISHTVYAVYTPDFAHTAYMACNPYAAHTACVAYTAFCFRLQYIVLLPIKGPQHEPTVTYVAHAYH